MSRDGLLPPIFSRIHPKYKTPSFSTIVTGFVVAIPALFMNLKEVVDLSSIGTLFAFVLVCGGVLVLQNSKDLPATPRFRTPYVNGRFIVPALYIIGAFVCYRYFQREGSGDLFRAVRENVPALLFIVVATAVTVLSFLKRL